MIFKSVEIDQPRAMEVLPPTYYYYQQWEVEPGVPNCADHRDNYSYSQWTSTTSAATDENYYHLEQPSHHYFAHYTSPLMQQGQQQTNSWNEAVSSSKNCRLNNINRKVFFEELGKSIFVCYTLWCHQLAANGPHYLKVKMYKIALILWLKCFWNASGQLFSKRIINVPPFFMFR